MSTRKKVARVAGPLALFAGAAVIGWLTTFQGIQPNDEGLMLAAVSRIVHGQVPYHDFWWFYPPGQPYLLALPWKIFGPSLVAWRVVRLAANATVALLAYFLARRRAGPGASVVAWLVAALAMAYPTGPHPFPIALALALGALLAWESRPGLAGALTGLCALWRIEFAVFLAAGVSAALLLRPGLAGWRQRAAPLVRFLAWAVGLAVVLYLPVLIAAGFGTAWRLLVKYPLTEFGRYQTLPFPIRYDGPLNTGIPGFFTDSAEPLLLFYLPLVLLIGAALATLRLLLRARRRDTLIAPLVFTGGMVSYLLVRADLFHTAPLAVMVGILGAWAISVPAHPEHVRGRDLRGAIAAAAGFLAAGALGFLLVEGADRVWLVRRAASVSFHGVQVEPSIARPLAAAVGYVRARVPPGQPIYVTGRRADLVTAGAPLFYVLARRPNPTRYDIAAPGVVTSAPVQTEIVDDLLRVKPRLVVRWTDPVTATHEPDPAGRSSGVTLLDDYLNSAYAPVARFGDWTISARRASP